MAKMMTCCRSAPSEALVLLLVSLLCQALLGCSRQPGGDRSFGFEVENETGRSMSEVALSFIPSGKVAGVGDLGIHSAGAMGALEGPVPDAADVGWLDSDGKKHSVHVQITPLPPPTRTSYMGSDRQIYFVINANNSVMVFGHCPGMPN